MKTYIYKGIATLLFCAALCSCEKMFVRLNTNPYEASKEMMEADNNFLKAYITQLQRNVIVFADGSNDDIHTDAGYQNVYNLCADTWAGYFAPTGSWESGNHHGKFKIIDQWSGFMFKNVSYPSVMNAWTSVHEIAGEMGSTVISAVADILKVAHMHQTTDYYGPIPYSEVGKVLSPVYDSQQEVYNQFFTELGNAIDVLSEYLLQGGTQVMDPELDYVYGGDTEKWIRFANSLRLRLAMRISYADKTLAASEAAKSFSNSVGFIETNAQNAGLLKGIVPHHPIQEINLNMNDGDTQMGASIDCYMNGYSDPRSSFYANLITTSSGWSSSTTLRGVRNGITPGDTYRNSSKTYSSPKAENYQLIWMNAAEVWFLRAEAALAMWGFSEEDAQYCYETGVQTSFDQWGAGSASSYLNDNSKTSKTYPDYRSSGKQTYNTKPSSTTVRWDGSASDEMKQSKIIIQKWLALFPNGAEAWAEYRRTGYPGLVPSVSNLGGCENELHSQACRAVYPTSEQSQNPTGYASGVEKLGGQDLISTKVWWDKKDKTECLN